MVTTISNTVNAFLIPHIKMLIEYSNQVDVAFKVEQEVSSELSKLGVTAYEIPFSRKIYKNRFIKLVKQVRKLIRNNNYDIVHTHTPIASAIVRLACKDLPHTKVFYTAHGFHFYKGAPKINWMTFFPIEKALSRYTDTLITINQEDYEFSKTFYAKNNFLVPGIGIDLKKFNEEKFISVNNISNQLNIGEGDFTLLSIGELNKNKNHEIVIKALSQLKKPNIHYLIAGEGSLKQYLSDLAVELNVDHQVHFLGYRKDIKNLLTYSDVFIFPSFREGLSVSVMEAMATGKPVIASNIRGNIDLIEHGKGGFLFEPNDVDGLIISLESLIKKQKYIHVFGEYNKQKIIDYSLESILTQMKIIYHLN